MWLILQTISGGATCLNYCVLPPETEEAEPVLQFDESCLIRCYITYLYQGDYTRALKYCALLMIAQENVPNVEAMARCIANVGKKAGQARFGSQQGFGPHYCDYVSRWAYFTSSPLNWEDQYQAWRREFYQSVVSGNFLNAREPAWTQRAGEEDLSPSFAHPVEVIDVEGEKVRVYSACFGLSNNAAEAGRCESILEQEKNCYDEVQGFLQAFGRGPCPGLIFILGWFLAGRT